MDTNTQPPSLGGGGDLSKKEQYDERRRQEMLVHKVEAAGRREFSGRRWMIWGLTLIGIGFIIYGIGQFLGGL